MGTLSPAPTDLRALLSELAELLNEDLAKRSISLAISVSEHVPIVTADRIQLQQAIHNLIVNSSEAIQGVGRPGRITVRATADATGACSITVQDNGPGFPPGFNFNEPTPFTSTKPEGSGLGLGVARSIAEAHGGRLTIASTSRGVTATLTIPKTEVKLDSNDRNH